MPLTNAEKQRRYRAKRNADAARRGVYLEKEKQKYMQDKELGKKKLIKDMTPREHRCAKKQWKMHKQSAKRRQTLHKNQLTPPQSPALSPPIQESRQKLQGRKLKNRSKSKAQRKVVLLQKQLTQEKKKADMYRKRLERLSKRENKVQDTPRSKTRNLLRHLSQKTVKKTLLFHNVLLDAIKQKYKSGGQKSKKYISDMLRGNILRKYKLKTHAAREIGFSNHGKHAKTGCLSKRMKENVQAFFLRDDVSRITTGLKNTVTRQKVKRQKRLLNDTMLNLHVKYSSEIKGKIGYTTFTRLRPFWVTVPNEMDRKTCLCKMCENVQYLSRKLQDLNLIQKCGTQSLLKHVVCDTSSQTCMYGVCGKCKEKRIVEHVANVNDAVTWLQWKTKKETKMIRGSPKEITTVVKETQSGRIGDLVDQFHVQIIREN